MIGPLAYIGGKNRLAKQIIALLPEHQTYVEPFALRALGVARADETLVRQAADRFEAIGLNWHAGETRKLLPS